MSKSRFQLGMDTFRCEESGKTCTVRVDVSQQTADGCECYVLIKDPEKTIEQTVIGENWYQAVTLAGKFIRLSLDEHYPGYRCEDGEGTTSGLHCVYPRIVDPYYGTDVYDDVCNYMDKKIQAIEDDMTRRFGTHEDGNEDN